MRRGACVMGGASGARRNTAAQAQPTRARGEKRLSAQTPLLRLNEEVWALRTERAKDACGAMETAPSGHPTPTTNPNTAPDASMGRAPHPGARVSGRPDRARVLKRGGGPSLLRFATVFFRTIPTTQPGWDPHNLQGNPYVHKSLVLPSKKNSLNKAHSPPSKGRPVECPGMPTPGGSPPAAEEPQARLEERLSAHLTALCAEGVLRPGGALPAKAEPIPYDLTPVWAKAGYSGDLTSSLSEECDGTSDDQSLLASPAPAPHAAPRTCQLFRLPSARRKPRSQKRFVGGLLGRRGEKRADGGGGRYHRAR